MLSEVAYAAFLSYTPRPSPQSEEQARSKLVCHTLKQDGYWLDGAPLIRFMASRLRDELTPAIEPFLTPGTTLVPAPGSAPIKSKSTLWVPSRICQELAAVGLGGTVEPLLVRHTAVPKSAFAAPRHRPTVQAHCDSMRVNRKIATAPRKLTLVDDVVTRGTMLFAGACLLAEAFPGAEIRAFAVVRTISDALRFRRLVDPVAGVIFGGHFGTRRVPY